MSETKPETKATEKRVVILNPQRMGLAEQLRQDWVVNAEEKTTVQDVLNPGYWAHMAAQLQPYDHIEVRLETGEWALELIVLSVGRNYAQVFLAHKYDFAEVDPTRDDIGITHKVEWKGPQKKHCVIRLSDSAVIQDGFSAKVDANQWLDNYLKTTQQ
jgi:hypothetical protein